MLSWFGSAHDYPFSVTLLLTILKDECGLNLI
jgi:hypothetical protein